MVVVVVVVVVGRVSGDLDTSLLCKYGYGSGDKHLKRLSSAIIMITERSCRYRTKKVMSKY